MRVESARPDDEFEIEDEWPPFKPNELGYMARRVEGLDAAYFVAEQTDGRLQIIHSASGNTKAQVRRRADGRWMFQGYCAAAGETPAFRDTCRHFTTPRRALLQFNHYLRAIEDPSTVTRETYLAYGGKPEAHENATREKQARVVAQTLIGRSYRACRGPHKNETITVTGLAEVTEGDRYTLESESGRRWTAAGDLIRRKFGDPKSRTCGCKILGEEQPVMEEISEEASEIERTTQDTQTPEKDGAQSALEELANAAQGATLAKEIIQDNSATAAGSGVTGEDALARPGPEQIEGSEGVKKGSHLTNSTTRPALSEQFEFDW